MDESRFRESDEFPTGSKAEESESGRTRAPRWETRASEGSDQDSSLDPAQHRGREAFQSQGSRLAIADRRSAAEDRQEGELTRLHQPALHDSRLDEGRKQRMRLKGPRLQLGMELHADEPGMVLVFDDLRQHAVRRQA